MAAVLDALVPYAKKLIKDMAEEEVSMLLGVSGEITKLEGNLDSLRAFVSDAESRRITQESVQKWVSKLKDAMYDATDIIELCQLEADERRELEEAGGIIIRDQNHLLACCQPLLVWLQSPVASLITCGGIEKMQEFFHRFLFCLGNPVFAHEIGGRIKELNQRLEVIYKEGKEFSFQTVIGSSNPEPRKLAASDESSSYKTSSHVDESAIVGEQIERDTKELVQVLIADDNNHDIKVVSIVGTGGMGKTTLAQKIFNDETIQDHFKTKRIWLSITLHFDEVELLRTAIKHAGGNPGDERDKSTLINTLIDTLSTGKFLLVMDDVWNQKAWDGVFKVPVKIASKKRPGSRVLVTTRYAHLPPQMQAALHQHRVNPLGKDDAWSLLKKQLQPDQVVGIDQLKTIGMQILEKCDGLPLAIKVIGGLLSIRYPSEHEWKIVLNKPAWSQVGLPSEIDSRLYLSYEDLSPQLKQCFLYCSLFSKGENIIFDVVTGMWISEGLIQPPDKRSVSSDDYELEDIATEYYQELIKRNLIEPTQKYSQTGNICTMHDVVRTFAEYMAREESLVLVDKDHAATIGDDGMIVRHLSVGNTVSALEWTALQRQEKLKTLIINSRISIQPGDSLDCFSRLRVLYIWSSDSDTLVPSLSKLKHLRHLHLEKTDISRLPDDIHKLRFLLNIYLLVCRKLNHLPSSIVKLVHLRSLDITSSNISALPKGFGELTNLRLLYGFPVHIDMDDASGNTTWCSLQELAPLVQLRKLKLDGLEKVHDSWMAEKAMISSKSHLRYLQLNYSASEHTSVGKAEQQQVLEMLRPPTSIENIFLRGGYCGCQLPKWMYAPASVEFKSLRYLKLENLPCCTELPDGLCCLPCLEMLNIIDAPSINRIGPQFQMPSSLVAGASTATTKIVSASSFPKLRWLNLEGLRECEEWEWNEHRDVEIALAMPCLGRLKIDKCKLTYLPPGLASSKRHTLRELYLYELTNLTYLENFPSVVELDVFDCPKLKRISGIPMLQKIRIVRCPKLEVLEGVAALNSLLLADATMDMLPRYLLAVKPRVLELGCNKKLYESCLSPGSTEWNKISHIRKHTIALL